MKGYGVENPLFLALLHGFFNFQICCSTESVDCLSAGIKRATSSLLETVEGIDAGDFICFFRWLSDSWNVFSTRMNMISYAFDFEMFAVLGSFNWCRIRLDGAALATGQSEADGSKRSDSGGCSSADFYRRICSSDSDVRSVSAQWGQGFLAVLCSSSAESERRSNLFLPKPNQFYCFF